MDKYKNFCKISSKSKSISRTPAQDRLKALQNRLQVERKTNEVPIAKRLVQEPLSNQVIIKNDFRQHRGNTKSSLQNRLTTSENVVQLNVYGKYSKLNEEDERNLNNSPKTTESCSHKSAIKNDNILNEVNISVTPNKESKSESPSKSKLSSLWKSVKTLFGSKVVSKSSVEQEDEISALQLNNYKESNFIKKKQNFEKDLRFIKSEENNCINNLRTSTNVRNIFKDEKFKIEEQNSLKSNASKNELTQIEQKQKSNDVTKYGSMKRHIEETEHDNDDSFTKKRKLNSNINKVNKISTSIKNEKLHNNLSMNWSSNVPISSVPGGKFSVNNRLQNLRQQLEEKNTSHNFNSKKQTNVSNPENKKINSANRNPVSSAEMETRNIFPSINQLTTRSVIENNHEPAEIFENYDIVNSNLMNLSDAHNSYNEFRKDYFYIVPDTNVFLNDFAFLKDLIKSKLCDSKGSILYIPYIVLQELDKLKMQTEKAISVKASRVIKYLNENFTVKNFQFKGQSAIESKRHSIKIENPDDHIINCCLQLKSHHVKYILLSNDINLRNKAICNDIICSSRDILISGNS